MLIDWYTVGAQVINFLVLVWLLRRFLYQPILDAIRAREQRIAAQLADAAAKQAAATRERDAFKQRNTEFDAQRAALFGKVSEEAKTERQRLLEQTRNEAGALRSRLQEALCSEQQGLSAEISRRTSQEVFAIARKTLAELATTSLEDSMTRVLIERIGLLSAGDKTLLASSIEAGSATAIVRSAFELAAQQRLAIEQALAEVCGAAPRLSFEVIPGLIAGVELSANGRKLAWSIADYLGSLEKSIAEILRPAVPAVLSDPAPAAMPVPGAAPASAAPAVLAAGSG